jgi:hypothetical protein
MERSWRRAWVVAAVVCAVAQRVHASGHIGTWSYFNGGSFGSITFSDVLSVE